MKDEKTRIKQDKIIDLVSSFCDDKLNEEYKDLSIKLVEKLGRKHDVPFKRGKLEIWASAVIYALGQINFLFDKSFEPYSTPDEICNYFNTKKSTVSNKAHDIREMLNLNHFDEEFSTGYMLESAPTFFIDEKSGMIIPEEYINPMDSYFDEVYNLFSNGEIDEAIAMLDVIDEDNPEYERAMFYKSFILNAVGIEDNSSEIFQDFLSELDVDLNDLLVDNEFDENNPEDLMEMGLFNYEIEEYADAIDNFDSCLEISPNNLDAIQFKALSLAELKRYKQALKIINNAIKNNPSSDELYNTKGILLKKSKQFDKALKSYDKAIELNPDDEFSWKDKGDIYLEQNKHEKALECYDKALEIDSNDIEYYILKAHVYMDLKDYESAEEIFNKAEKINDNNLDLLVEKGNFLLVREKLDDALGYYNKCLEIDDEYAAALLFKAVVCAQLNQEQELEKCVDKLVEINPMLLMELDNILED